MVNEIIGKIERLQALYERNLDPVMNIEIEDMIMNYLLELIRKKACFLIPIENSEEGVKYPHCFIESVKGEFLLLLPTLEAARYAEEDETQSVEFGHILQVALDCKELDGVFLGLAGNGLALMREDIELLIGCT